MPALFMASAAFGVFGRFHKPMVLTGVISTLLLILLTLGIAQNKNRVLKRAGALALSASLLLAGAQLASGGAFAAAVEEAIYARYLHQPQGFQVNTTAELLESAAGGRYDLWRDTWNRFYQSPWVGSGFGQTIQSRTGVALPRTRLSRPPLVAVSCRHLGRSHRPRVMDSYRHEKVRPVTITARLASRVLIRDRHLAYNMGTASRVFTANTGLVGFCLGLTAAVADVHIGVGVSRPRAQTPVSDARRATPRVRFISDRSQEAANQVSSEHRIWTSGGVLGRGERNFEQMTTSNRPIVLWFVNACFHEAAARIGQTPNHKGGWMRALADALTHHDLVDLSVAAYYQGPIGEVHRRRPRAANLDSGTVLGRGPQAPSSLGRRQSAPSHGFGSSRGHSHPRNGAELLACITLAERLL